ncbi:MAG: helix-turn-helix transcriptional regulator [Nocardioides sp.]
MSTITEPVAHDEANDVPQDCLEVHRDGPLSLLVGGTAGVLAVAFLLRAVGSGGVLPWLLFVVTAAIATMHLAAVVDARAPLLVLDRLGVRVRRGASWQGVSWSEVDRVEHRSRTSIVRDGSLSVVTSDGRHLGVRLSLSTRLIGADWHEVGQALEELSAGAVCVVALSRTRTAADDATEPVARSAVEPETARAAGLEPEPEPEQHLVAEAPEAVTPARASRPARRSEMFIDSVLRRERLAELESTMAPTADDASDTLDEADAELRGDDEPLYPSHHAETQTILFDGVLEDSLAEPAAPVASRPEPVVGRQLAAARERIGISIEALAERTRIRPHVIESIEVDDFEPCGGDFYARGHLRTLARVLGVEATELLALYDERYAHAPIDARRVFEAELASTSTRRQHAGGRLNWSVLVAAVMAVVLVWSVARLVMEGPVPLSDQSVMLNGSPSGKATLSGATTKVPVSLTAATGGARVIVRDARQQVVFDAQLAFMQTAELTVAPPVRVSTTDGGLLVTVDGVEEGALGATGQDAQRTYVP